MDTKAAHGARRERKRQGLSNTTIIRVDLDKGNWSALSRTMIEDDRLSFDGRGVAAWFLARPQGWEIRAGALPYLLKDATRVGGHVGRDFTRRVLRELTLCGYLSRKQTRSPSGQWRWESVFRAKLEDPTIDGFTVDGSSVDGKGVDILQTDYSRQNQYTPTTTTTPSVGDPAPQAAVVVSNDIRYPRCFGGEKLTAAQAIVERCPIDQRQAVLDELDAMHTARRVRSPLGLLHRLVERAAKGEFVPNLSTRISRPRPSTSTKPAASEERGKATAGGPGLAGDIAEQMLARLREKHRKAPC